ncbi:MAG: HNH endonuclease [Prevotella sp.]|nr:HNH endonuclease [Prevotella sp.]
MKNLEPNRISIEDEFEEAKKGLHEDKRAFMHDREQDLKNAFAEYDRLSNENNLHLLNPLISNGDNDYETAKSIYNSNRPILIKHRETLKNHNGGETIFCPICGLKPAEQMDHYAPQDKFAEFSFHLRNLIPLCGNCNRKKATKWLDNNGNRLIWNAYYDAPPSHIPIECTISLDACGMPMISSVDISSMLQQNTSDGIVISTIYELELLREYQVYLVRELRDELNRITNAYDKRKDKMSKQDFWNQMLEEYPLNGNVSIVKQILHDAILNSENMKSWVIRHLQ